MTITVKSGFSWCKNYGTTIIEIDLRHHDAIECILKFLEDIKHDRITEIPEDVIIVIERYNT